jgi:hypothetical protein
VKTKTAYRLPKNTPAEEPADIPEEIQPSASTTINFNTDKSDPVEATVAAIEPVAPADEATLALQKQLADLKKSEALQREFAQRVAAQRAAQMAAQPPTREQKLEMWRQQGMSPADEKLLIENPQMIDFHDLTAVAAAQAAEQGHERDSEGHRAATLEAFHRLQGQQAQEQAAQPTPAFFAPKPAPSPAAPGPASFVSAPVSRTVPGYREPNPRSVRLSPEEQQIAAASGISDAAYAKLKLKMLRERAAGERE